MRKTAKFYVLYRGWSQATLFKFDTQKKALNYIQQQVSEYECDATLFTLIKGHELSLAAKTTVTLQVVLDSIENESDTESDTESDDTQDDLDLTMGVAS